MSIFHQEFSPEMAPSIDERTVGEFQQAHALVHGFINSKGRLTAENIDDAVRGCFEGVQSIFSQETRAGHGVAVRQFIGDAQVQLERLREEIEATQESASHVVRSKRARETDQEEAPQAKRVRAESPVLSAKEALPLKIYNGFLAKLGNPESVQEFYSQISPSSLEMLKQVERSEEIMNDWSEIFSQMCETMGLLDPQNFAQHLNRISDIFQHLRSFDTPPSIEECFGIANQAFVLYSLITILYPEEEPNTVWKRLLNPETIEMIGNSHDPDPLNCLALSGGSRALFSSLSSEIASTLLQTIGDGKEFREFLSQLSPTTLEMMKQVSDELGPSSPELWGLDLKEICRKEQVTGPQGMAQLLNRISDVFQHLHSFDRPPSVKDSYTIATQSACADFLIAKLFPGEETGTVWKRLLNPETIGMIQDTERPETYYCLALSKGSCTALSGGSQVRFDFLSSSPFFFNWDNPENIRPFMSLSEPELLRIQPLVKRLSERLEKDTLIPPLSDEERISFLQRWIQDPRLARFMQYVSDHPRGVRASDLEAVMDWYLWFSALSERGEAPPQSSCPLCTGFPWTQEEVETILQSYGPNTKAMRFWDAELTGRVEDEISQLPLNTVPTELLVRFLGSKLFPETKAWLETIIDTPTGKKARVDTLSESQKTSILRSFRGDDTFGLPSEGWRQVLHTSEEEAKRICRQEEPPVPEGAEAYQRELPAEFDPADPFPLLLHFGGGNSTKALVEGLVNAKVESLCGERTFLTWGSAMAGSSVCVTRDAQPVHFRDHEQPLSIYPRGLFNDPTFGVSALSLRRRLLSLRDADPEEYSRILDDADLEEFQSKEGLELALELQRVQMQMHRKLSASHLDKVSRRETFRDHLKRLCLEGAGAAEKKGAPKVDLSDSVPRNAFLFLSLLQLARNTQVQREKEGMLVKIEPGLAFRVQSLESPDIKKLKEDNPGIADLESYAEDFPLHSLTPVTPKNVTPESFQRLVSSVQGLTEGQYQELCDSCVKLASLDLGEYPPTAQCFEEWKKLWPQGVHIDDEGAHALAAIAERYIPDISTERHADEPSGTYQLSPNPDEFYPKLQVPLWLPVSNFSGAICASFIPHNPQRHDGNCGVNSFLLGYYGSNAYQGENARRLSSDIAEFRRNVVAYAQEHRDELCEEFGTKEIDDIIAHYGTRDWTGQGVWGIVARLYGREIRIYSAETHGNLFRREDHTLVPFDEHDVFKPKEEEKGPPIHIVYFGEVHYANLEPKPSDVEMTAENS